MIHTRINRIYLKRINFKNYFSRRQSGRAITMKWNMMFFIFTKNNMNQQNMYHGGVSPKIHLLSATFNGSAYKHREALGNVLGGIGLRRFCGWIHTRTRRNTMQTIRPFDRAVCSADNANNTIMQEIQLRTHMRNHFHCIFSFLYAFHQPSVNTFFFILLFA